MNRRLALALFLVLAGCSPKGDQPVEGQGEATAGVSPFKRAAVIYPVERGLELLNQCSRAIPDGIATTWAPSPADIVQLESRLLPWLEQQRPAAYPHGVPVEMDRNYAGFVMKGGRRVIYLDAAVLRPNDPPPAPNELPDRPYNSVCDGGPAFFGVEYDVKAKTFANLRENGPY